MADFSVPGGVSRLRRKDILAYCMSCTRHYIHNFVY